MNKIYLRPAEIVDLGYAPSLVTLWRWTRDGRFPPAVKLGPNVVAYPAESLDRHRQLLEAGEEPSYLSGGNPGPMNCNELAKAES